MFVQFMNARGEVDVDVDVDVEVYADGLMTVA